MSNKNIARTILILGANGMLGSGLAKVFFDAGFDLQLQVRPGRKRAFMDHAKISVAELSDFAAISAYITKRRPDIVINCIGVIKQSDNMQDKVETISVNALLPHRLAEVCNAIDSRLIHFSTDCVFTGSGNGCYSVDDIPDATDLYGRSKLLGEVDYGRALTLRTSIIGREYDRALSLVDWYLAQTSPIKGYRKAVFSGLPVNEIGRFLVQYIVGVNDIAGLYQLSADPIDKFELLRLVQAHFEAGVDIIPDDSVVIDRSLSSQPLKELTGYKPAKWEQLISEMAAFYKRAF